MQKSRYKLKVWQITLLLLLLMLAAGIACMCIGKYEVTPKLVLQIIFSKVMGIESTWPQMTENVVMMLRLPRILATLFVGAALSMSGAAYQGVFKNPLVSPDILGVSSGATIGAAIAILMALPSAMIQTFAFCGGLIAVGLTMMIPNLLRSQSNIMLVLSGIIVGGLMSSIMGFIKYIADPETQLATITYWQMGSFSYISLQEFVSVIPFMVISTIVILAISWWIDILSLGEREAKTLGANVLRIRAIVVACATLLTASSVCIAGTIGWIGLVVPHLGRMIVGPDNIKLMPVAAVIGAIFLLLVDTLTRVIGPAEMPISILTGIVGAPFFAWLLFRQRTKLS
jgi:iron complex transport system permease protein